jgi:hypothetical protein
VLSLLNQNNTVNMMMVNGCEASDKNDGVKDEEEDGGEEDGKGKKEGDQGKEASASSSLLRGINSRLSDIEFVWLWEINEKN